MADIIDRAANYSSERAQVAVIEQSTAISKSDRFVFYLQWSTYTLFAGITVCVGLLVTTLGRVDVRRRNLSSPLSFASYNLQLGAACMARSIKKICHRDSGRKTVSLMKVEAADIVGSTAVTPTRNTVRWGFIRMVFASA